MSIYKKEILQELYIEKGFTRGQIAQILGGNPRTVGSYLHKYGLKKPSRDITKHMDIELIDKLVAEGWLLQDIAKEVYGCSRGLIYKFTASHGRDYKNHETKRQQQSQMMTTSNPTAGTKRPQWLIEILRENTDQRFLERVKYLEATGMTKRQYTQIARNQAYKVYGKSTPDGYHIDHIFSVNSCWRRNVPVLLVSHPNNLRLITAAENQQKSSSDDISYEEFLERCDVQRLSKSQYNWDWKKVE